MRDLVVCWGIRERFFFYLRVGRQMGCWSFAWVAFGVCGDITWESLFFAGPVT